MADNLNYKHLHYFWVVAKEGSIAKAASKLHITPQTISGQLSMLEDRINLPLFDRVGRGLRLTETGKLTMRYADQIFELGRDLGGMLRGAPQERTSEFTISAVSSISNLVVHKIIKPTLTLSDNINLISKAGRIESIFAELAVNQVDLVLTDTPLTSGYNVKAYNHYLGESGMSFFATPTLARALKGEFPSCLSHTPILLPSKHSIIRQLFDRWANELDLFPVAKGQFDDSALLTVFGQMSVGVFFMPTIVEQEVCEQYHVEVIGRAENLRQRYYTVTPEKKITHPAVVAVCDGARDIIFK